MRPESPYVGLDFFVEDDADYFFGREAERKRITSNLRASRLTLLYAQSGVGKSSLLRAGVAARQREDATRMSAESGSPDFLPVVHSRWQDDPIDALTQAIATAAKPFTNGLELPRDGLEPTLERVGEALDARVLVILDQFEELLAYHETDEAGERFANELARCILRPDLPANFLVSIREDAYSRLGDRFKTRIPNVYGNYLHLEYLDERAAREAIQLPLKQVNRELPQDGTRLEIEPGLVGDVLADALRTKGMESEGNGDGTKRYETAYLQLVMKHIWEREMALGSNVLRRETLARLGGGRAIIEAYFEGAISGLSSEQRSAAASAFGYLVTPAGTKNALTSAELADLSGRPEALLAPALQRMEQAQLLRAVASRDQAARYELFHDMLADPVSDWRRRHQAGERAREEVAEHRSKLIRRAAVALVVLAVLLAVAVWRAREQGSIARSQALAGNALSQLPVDPELGILLAKEAFEEHRTEDAEAALRRTLGASLVRGEMRIPAGKFIASRMPDVSADGSVVASASTDRLELWSTAGRGKRILRHEAPGIMDGVLAAGGGAVAINGAEDAVVLRVSGDAEPVKLRGGGYSYVVSMSPGGRFAAGYDINGKVRVWDARTGSKVATLGAPADPTFASDIELDPADPGRVVVSDCKGSTVLWNWRKNRTVELRDPASGAISQDLVLGCLISVSPDGRHAVEAMRSGATRLWDLEDGRLVAARLGRREVVNDIAWSRDGDRVAVASGKTASVFGVRTGKLLSRPAGHTDFTHSVAFTNDAAMVVTSSRDGTARVWDVRSRALLADLRGHGDSIPVAGFLNNGMDVVTVSTDGTARVWRVADGRVLRGHRNWVLSTAIDRSGRVASVSVDGRAAIWPIKGDPVWVRLPKTRQLSSIAFDADGRRLAIAGDQGAEKPRLLIVDAKTGDLEADIEPPVWMFTARFSPADNNRLVAASDNGEIYFWALPDEEPSAKITLPWDQRARMAEYSPDGRRIVTAGADGVARIFDAKTEKPGAKYKRPGELWGATFSPDGTRVLSYGSDRTAQIWDAATGEELHVLDGHTMWVSSAAFSPDGKRVVTGSADHATRVWDAESGRLLSTQVRHGDSVNGVGFSRDGKTIVSGSDDWTVRLYECATCLSADDLVALADQRTFRDFTDEERKRYLES